MGDRIREVQNAQRTTGGVVCSLAKTTEEKLGSKAVPMNNNSTAHLTKSSPTFNERTLGPVIILLALQIIFSAVILYQLYQVRQNTVTLQTFLMGSPSSKPAVVSVGNVEIDDDPMLGNPDAPITIVEFGDFDCGYCAEAAGIMKEILTHYPNQVRLVYRDFPLTPNVGAAEAAQCAHEQGRFGDMHDWLLENLDFRSDETYVMAARTLGIDEVAFRECLSEDRYVEEIAADREAGEDYGVEGAPTFFINGRRIGGITSIDMFVEIIEEELNSK